MQDILYCILIGWDLEAPPTIPLAQMKVPCNKDNLCFALINIYLITQYNHKRDLVDDIFQLFLLDCNMMKWKTKSLNIIH